MINNTLELFDVYLVQFESCNFWFT